MLVRLQPRGPRCRSSVAERRIRNAQAAGSIPADSTIHSVSAHGSPRSLTHTPEAVWHSIPSTTTPAFEITSKRRKGFPSETKVKRGERIVHVCKRPHREARAQGSLPVRVDQALQELLHAQRSIRWHQPSSLLLGNERSAPGSLQGPFSLRAWPIGQAPAFQAGQAGSTPAARSMPWKLNRKSTRLVSGRQTVRDRSQGSISSQLDA